MKSADLPLVSVIIPVLNDEAGIRDSLLSVSEQDYPAGSMEVIVVDNNSTDNTASVAQTFTAYNSGIKVSRGKILAFIDADMTASTSWISRGVSTIVSEGADYVGCKVDIIPKNNPVNIWELYNQQTGFQMKVHMEKDGFAGAGCLFVRKKVFDEIGLFDHRYISGDWEFGNLSLSHRFCAYLVIASRTSFRAHFMSGP